MDLEEDSQDYLVNLKIKTMDLFGRKKVKALEKQLEEAFKALVECNCKLVDKQEHINTTNAYWKKKLREMERPSKSKKDL